MNEYQLPPAPSEIQGDVIQGLRDGWNQLESALGQIEADREKSALEEFERLNDKLKEQGIPVGVLLLSNGSDYLPQAIYMGEDEEVSDELSTQIQRILNEYNPETYNSIHEKVIEDMTLYLTKAIEFTQVTRLQETQDNPNCYLVVVEKEEVWMGRFIPKEQVANMSLTEHTSEIAQMSKEEILRLAKDEMRGLEGNYILVTNPVGIISKTSLFAQGRDQFYEHYRHTPGLFSLLRETTQEDFDRWKQHNLTSPSEN